MAWTIAGSATRRRPLVRSASFPERRQPGPGYANAKRALDLTVCLVALPIALPLFVLCALAVKLSGPGPLFFAQERTGIGARRFRMYKFRTMVPDAARMKAEIRTQLGITGPDFKLANDPRITRFGHFLRRTSLDELPQIWNILRGDMTLVGPRPTSFEAGTYDLWHTERLEVVPGLTGLWQIARRGDIDFDDRVRLDIAYVRNRSFLLDLSILIRTIPAVLFQRGAY